jgi:hypothetical protein
MRRLYLLLLLALLSSCSASRVFHNTGKVFGSAAGSAFAAGLYSADPVFCGKPVCEGEGSLKAALEWGVVGAGLLLVGAAFYLIGDALEEEDVEPELPLHSPPLKPAAAPIDDVNVETVVVQPHPQPNQGEVTQEETDDCTDEASGARIAAGVFVHVGCDKGAQDAPDQRVK